jgi:hypothetical protein
MLTLILSLLGAGGISGAALYFVGPAALLKLAKGVPKWAWGVLIVAAVLVLGYCHAEKTGETKGAAKVEAKQVKKHEANVAAARADEHTAQATTDRIGARVAGMDAATTDYLRNQLEELHHEIDAAKAAPAGGGPPVVDTASLSARLDEGIARSNRDAEAADAQP